MPTIVSVIPKFNLGQTQQVRMEVYLMSLNKLFVFLAILLSLVALPFLAAFAVASAIATPGRRRIIHRKIEFC